DRPHRLDRRLDVDRRPPQQAAHLAGADCATTQVDSAQHEVGSAGIGSSGRRASLRAASLPGQAVRPPSEGFALGPGGGKQRKPFTRTGRAARYWAATRWLLGGGLAVARLAGARLGSRLAGEALL